jgi:hypothetical protein
MGLCLSSRGIGAKKIPAADPMEEVMIRKIAFVVGYAVIQVLSNPALVAAVEFGTAEDA